MSVIKTVISGTDADPVENWHLLVSQVGLYFQQEHLRSLPAFPDFYFSIFESELNIESSLSVRDESLLVTEAPLSIQVWHPRK
jgi:hypothetical protein